MLCGNPKHQSDADRQGTEMQDRYLSVSVGYFQCGLGSAECGICRGEIIEWKFPMTKEK